MEKQEYELTNKDVELLNSRVGLKALFSSGKVNLKKALKLAQHETELREKQVELVKLQNWVIENKKKVVIIFEGRDAAGKGGAIRRISAHINPRHYKIVALPKPTQDEMGQWYFQRYVDKLPKPGEIVFFDRSWYNRAIVEPVNKFCSMKEYKIFMDEVNQFEQMIMNSDTYLLKYYYSITKEEQQKRLDDLRNNPLKRWKITPVDEKALELWDDYTEYKKKMIEKTNPKTCPWTIVDANDKMSARLTTVKDILERIPYNT